MERLPTQLDGLVLLAPAKHGDERGFFMETFRADTATATLEWRDADLHNRQSLGGHFSDRQLVEMATANPGSALSGPWEVPCGQLVNGGLADLVVVSKRDPDPWRNLIAAVESDVEPFVEPDHECR